jgi:hypothetical protein
MHTARDISETAKQLYRNQKGLGARLQTLRPYICSFEELLPLVPHLVPFGRVRQHLTSTGVTEVLSRSTTRYWYAHEWGVFVRKA